MKKKKRNDISYDEMITYERIFNAWNTVRRTCKNRREVMRFALNLNSNLHNVYEVLKNKNYNPSRYHTFMIFEPKPRLVMSQNVFDKIVNHFIANNYLIPLLDDCLMELNVATRTEKGFSYAMNMIKKYVNKIVINEKPDDIYCLKIDVSKYFYTIDHNILIEKLKKRIGDKDILNIIQIIIDETNKDYINQNINYYNHYYGTDIPCYINNKGLSIGAMTSQFLAIFYLSNLDHFIVEKLHCYNYCRYMDDILVFDTNKNKLKYAWKEIEKEITKLNLKMNNKSNFYRLSKGVDFLGFNYKYKNKKLHISFKKKTFYKVGRRLKNLKNKDKYKYKKSLASYYGYYKVVDKKLKRGDFKMKNIDLYDAYKAKYSNSIVLVKEGIFYTAYRDDANIIWHKFLCC